MQAVGDSGQGWGNAVLYIFLSPKIRTRLFCDPCQACLRVCGRKLQVVGQRLSSVGVHRLDESHSTSSSQPQHAGPVEQRSRGTASASSTSRGRSEPSESAGPSETSEPAPPVPISVVPGYRTILVKNWSECHSHWLFMKFQSIFMNIILSIQYYLYGDNIYVTCTFLIT